MNSQPKERCLHCGSTRIEPAYPANTPVRYGEFGEPLDNYDVAVSCRDCGALEDFAITIPELDELDRIEAEYAEAPLPEPDGGYRLPKVDLGGIIPPLTPAESEVARLIAASLPNKLIAYEMNIAESTVKTHVGNILGKLKLGNRTAIALWTLNQIVPESHGRAA